MGSPANPFSTSAIHPGAIAYRFAFDDANSSNVSQLIERFEKQHQGRAAIVGPHGTGKTTLLCTLAESLERTFERVQWERCLAGDRNSRRIRWDRALQPQLLVIDGYEQMALWHRVWIRIQTARHGCRLLVTAHRKRLGLPVLVQTRVSLALAQELVRELLQDCNDAARNERCLNALPQLLAQHQGNFRETLFALYDKFDE